MLMMLASMIPGLALLVGTQASSPVAAPTPAPEKKQCKAFVPTGSSLPKRICLTKSEWRRFNGANQASADDFLGRRTAGMCDNGLDCR